METVSLEQVGTSELALPPRVQEALGKLVGAAKEGLLALSVGVGLGVQAELLEEDVVEVVGAKGKHDPERTAVRHGHDAGEALSAAAGSRSSGRGSGAPKATARCRFAPTGTSPTATR